MLKNPKPPARAVTEPDDETADRGRDLDVAHVADLANLPLEEEKREEMEAACQEVLDAFQLPDLDETPGRAKPVRAFPDEAVPWPREGIEAIVDAFPESDGRLLSE